MAVLVLALRGFRHWMGLNHVRMEGQIRSALAARVPAEAIEIHRAYGGLWTWLSCLAAPATASFCPSQSKPAASDQDQRPL